MPDRSTERSVEPGRSHESGTTQTCPSVLLISGFWPLIFFVRRATPGIRNRLPQESEGVDFALSGTGRGERI